MSFADDMAEDLNSAFFADLPDVMYVDGVPYNGQLLRRMHAYAETNVSHHVFLMPANPVLMLRRDSLIFIGEQRYVYVQTDPSEPLNRVLLAPQS
tara:strand:- start:106 stop:390 length:285 start_codon:yes stop_codon:yes gene_type:complete